MGTPDRKLLLAGFSLIAAVGSAGCGKPTEAPQQATSQPDHPTPVACPSKMPWEGTVINFASIRMPDPIEKPNKGPECWQPAK